MQKFNLQVSLLICLFGSLLFFWSFDDRQSNVVPNSTQVAVPQTHQYIAVDTALARELYKKGKQLFHDIKYDSSIIVLHQAYAMFEQAAEVYRDTMFWRAMLITHNALGYTYIDRKDSGDDEMALFHLRKALEIGSEVLDNRHDGVANAHNLIGLVYFDKGKQELAFNQFKNAIRLQKKFSGPLHENIGNSLLNIGLYFYYIHELDSARFYTEQSLRLRLQIHENWHYKISEC